MEQRCDARCETLVARSMSELQADMRPGLAYSQLALTTCREKQTPTTLYMYYYDLHMAEDRRAFSTLCFSTLTRNVHDF
jgi:hypothetical protein